VSFALASTVLTWWLAAGVAWADAPSNTALPSISGVAQQGDQLTANPGTWSGDDPITFSYQWSDGQTGSTITLSDADVGQSVSVTVTASNDAGTVQATSDTVGPVLPAAPSESAGGAPAVTGTAQQGGTLSVTNGAWSNNPTGFSYVWDDCNSSGTCSAINGATSTSYVLQASDVGNTIVAVVTASNAGGQTPATSNSVGPVLPAAPALASAPVLSGTAQQGDTLSVTSGSWNNNPTGYSYTWQACTSAGSACSPISGATSNSFKLTQAQVADYVTVTVVASNSGGQAPATSNVVGPVLPTPPTLSGAPVISGTAQQGNTLNVSNGSWTNNPTGYAYAWNDCNSAGTSCSPIVGATSSSYMLRPSDVGAYITASVAASNAGGSASPATSGTVGPVLPAAPVVTGAPGISGTAQQGSTLSASTGVWSNNPTGYSYVWQACTSAGSACSPISGATSNSFKLTQAQVGDYVSVIVTASNSGGHASVASAGIGPVLPPAPVSSKAPAITGTAQQGDTLSVSNGTWNNNPSAYTYAWEGCNSAGKSCVPIGGATLSSYTLSAADIGDTIVCIVTARGLGGSTAATSNTTAVVVAAPTPLASQPTITTLLASPTSAVTNEGVTLVATVTSGSASSTALWGTVMFTNGGATIGGCANLPVKPSGQSATVACSASFAASTVQLIATFTPTAGSVLKGSVSPVDSMTVGPDSTSTALQVSSSVTVGAGTTYTATVEPPAERVGPVEPTGSIQFLDGGQPIAACASQPLGGGAATCTVTYAAAGAHPISARYIGDANFVGSVSPTEQVSAVLDPPPVIGTITSTMQWAFYFTPAYTQVRNLAVNGVSADATVLVKCHGRGCPFAQRAAAPNNRGLCGRKARMCFTGASFSITPGFGTRHLRVGARITVEIVRPSWVGKYYSFTVRSRRAPRIQISCLAPGGSVPGQGC
jgi:Bacterial Ig-like domain (group 3)